MPGLYKKSQSYPDLDALAKRMARLANPDQYPIDGAASMFHSISDISIFPKEVRRGVALLEAHFDGKSSSSCDSKASKWFK